MWPYWVMFLLPALGVFSANDRQRPGDREAQWSIAWRMAAIALTLAVGYRFNVGSDWSQYLEHLDFVRGAGLADIFAMSDPGYKLGNWLSSEMNWGIWGINLVCGGLLSAGLTTFCRNMPRPWLALSVSVPYLVIVVGMGYSRQAVALGLAMLGLVALHKKSTRGFVFWILLGATFHKTAVLLLPISALASAKNRYWTVAWVGAVTLGAYTVFLEDALDTRYAGYLAGEYQSEGALIRLLMNALPASILLVWWQRFDFSDEEGRLWRWLAIIALVLVAVVFVSPSSTAVDRIALYVLPLQLVVFSRLPAAAGRRTGSNQGWAALVLAYYAGVLFVWLNYASHARAWIPYRFYPLETL